MRNDTSTSTKEAKLASLGKVHVTAGPRYTPPIKEKTMDSKELVERYDAGLLNDFGSGDESRDSMHAFADFVREALADAMEANNGY